MRPLYHFAAIITTLLLSSCTSPPIILSDEYAYYIGDDSLAIVTDCNKIHNHIEILSMLISDTTDMSEPIPIERKNPEYPTYHVGESSYLVEAEVFVKVLVTKEGNVKRAYIMKSSEKTFNKPCLEAAMKWKFKPGLLKGEPVSIWVTIPFRFRLRK